MYVYTYVCYQHIDSNYSHRAKLLDWTHYYFIIINVIFNNSYLMATVDRYPLDVQYCGVCGMPPEVDA